MDIKALVVSVIVGAALWALALDAFGEWALPMMIALTLGLVLDSAFDKDKED